MEKVLINKNACSYCCSVFWPENFKINDLVDLRKENEVEVLTGRPNYPSGEIYYEYKQSPNEYSVYEVPLSTGLKIYPEE